MSPQEIVDLVCDKPRTAARSSCRENVINKSSSMWKNINPDKLLLKLLCAIQQLNDPHLVSMPPFTFTRLESCLDQPMDSSGIHEVVKYTPSQLAG